MNSMQYKLVDEEINNGEIIPFDLLKLYIDYKLNNNICNEEELIEFYRINDEISYKYLLNMQNNKEEDYYERFRELKFSLSSNHLKESSKKLNPEELNQENKFIENIPNQMFLKIVDNLNSIINSEYSDILKQKNITDYINNLFEIYSDINDMALFPITISSLNYSYNRLIFDFVDILKNILKDRKQILFTIENNNNANDDMDKTVEYKDYINEKMFISSYINVMELLSKFYKVFEEIALNGDDEENIYKIQIIIFYLNSYELNRTLYDKKIIKNIADILLTKTINEKILDKYEIFDKKGNKINKSNWKKIKKDQIVNIKINNEFVNNIRIKYFNINILNLNDKKLKFVLLNYSDDFLSVNGMRKESIIYFSEESELLFKRNLFNLLSSDMIKKGFKDLDPRLKEGENILKKFVFEGKYKTEIFEEILDNIIIIPFIYKNINALTIREYYKIYLNLNPNIYNISLLCESVTCLSSKLRDIYHEVFHIISILYTANQKKFEYYLYHTDDFQEKINKQKINDILNKYISQYSKDIPMKFEYTDMGDLMEIYLFGIKPQITTLYSSLYFSSILHNNKIQNINIEQFRENMILFSNSTNTFNQKEVDDFQEEKDKNDIIENDCNLIKILKYSEIRKIFINNFKENNIIFNYKFRGRYDYENNNIITNYKYLSYREPCRIKRKRW